MNESISSKEHCRVEGVTDFIFKNSYSFSISGRIKSSGVDRCISDGCHDCGLLDSSNPRIVSCWWIPQCVRTSKKWIPTKYS